MAEHGPAGPVGDGLPPPPARPEADAGGAASQLAVPLSTPGTGSTKAPVPGGVAPPGEAGTTGPGPAAPSTTRASATWTAVALGMVFLVVVVVFILENLQDVKVTFFGASWRVPLAIDLLLAAVLGGAVVFSAGAVRLLQLRVRSRRTKRQSAPSSRRRLRAHPGP